MIIEYFIIFVSLSFFLIKLSWKNVEKNVIAIFSANQQKGLTVFLKKANPISKPYFEHGHLSKVWNHRQGAVFNEESVSESPVEVLPYQEAGE